MSGDLYLEFMRNTKEMQIVRDAKRKFIEAGSEAAAREKGLIRTEGKDYIMQDGDICHFLTNK